jgi:hypothetical protein
MAKENSINNVNVNGRSINRSVNPINSTESSKVNKKKKKIDSRTNREKLIDLAYMSTGATEFPNKVLSKYKK